MRRDRIEAHWFAVPLRPFSPFGQGQESESACREARSRRRLEPLIPDQGVYRHQMAVRLTRNEIQLLKELTAAGEHGRIIAAPISSAEVAHLIGAQYIKRLPGAKSYAITERGRQALAEATAGQR